MAIGDQFDPDTLTETDFNDMAVDCNVSFTQLKSRILRMIDVLVDHALVHCRSGSLENLKHTDSCATDSFPIMSSAASIGVSCGIHLDISLNSTCPSLVDLTMILIAALLSLAMIFILFDKSKKVLLISSISARVAVAALAITGAY